MRNLPGPQFFPDDGSSFFAGLRGLGAAAIDSAAIAQQAGAALPSYPGWSGPVASMTALAGAALVGAIPMPISDPAVKVVKRTFWHQKDVNGTAGSKGPTFRFFNEGSAPFVTNLPIANQLPVENAFWVTTIRAALTYDYSATQAWTVLMMDWYRHIMENSECTFKVGDQVIVDRQRGLTSFPEGKGLGGILQQLVPTVTAGTATTVGRLSNGPISPEAKFEMAPTLILPTRNFSFVNEYAAETVAGTGFTNPKVWIGLEGWLVAPSNQ